MVQSDAISQFSNGMTGFRLLVFVFLPAFDLGTDVAFIVSFGSSCVKTVLDFDQSGGVFWAIMMLSVFATLAGALTFGSIMLRLTWFLCNNRGMVLAEAVARRELGAKYVPQLPSASDESASNGALASKSARSSGTASSDGAIAPSAPVSDSGDADHIKTSLLASDNVFHWLWRRCKAFALVHGEDVAASGPISRARVIRLTQSVLEDAIQVSVTFALVAGMKSQDTSTLFALYTSSAALAATLGTELWHTLHCCRQHVERAETKDSKEAETASLPADKDAASATPASATPESATPASATPASATPASATPASATPESTNSADLESGATSKSSGDATAPTEIDELLPAQVERVCGRWGECACVVEPCVKQGPCACFCRNQRCRRYATSVLGRIVCVGAAAFILLVVLISDQLAHYASGVASLRASISLSVMGTTTLPNGTTIRVFMPNMKVEAQLKPYFSVDAQRSNPKPREPDENRPFAVLTSSVHNDAAVSIGVGIDLSDFDSKYGPTGLGCALLWTAPKENRPADYAEVDVTDFVTRCLDTGASQGYNIPKDACKFPIALHPAHAPYDPSPTATSTVDSSRYTQLFGPECAAITKDLHVTGNFSLSFVGTCDLSSL